jgi:hypothetical protein
VRTHLVTGFSGNLSREEISDQISTFTLAGQDTVVWVLAVAAIGYLANHHGQANCFAFTLLELSRNPEWQEKIRLEVIAFYSETPSMDKIPDLDKLPLLNAHLKVNLIPSRCYSLLMSAIGNTPTLSRISPFRTSSHRRHGLTFGFPHHENVR